MSEEDRELTPDEKAALFPGATPEERAEVMMAAGRITFAGQPYVAAQIRAAIREAVAAERERCARICEQTHKELDAEFEGSGGCTDTALIAAERIRSGEEPK